MKGFDTGNGAKDHKGENSGINEINRYLIRSLCAFYTGDGKRRKTMLRFVLQGVV